MIVADVNLIAYYLIPGQFTKAAEGARARDNSWTAPALWSTEFLNVFATNVREKEISREAALAAWDAAHQVIPGTHEVQIDSVALLDLSVASRIATYDCEYVLYARTLGIPLVTNDKRVLNEFPDVAISIDDFAAGK
jgi:predicted nucleic acid-binding protein